MRLWTVHPRYLDAQGLVAVWREGLLAQAVLRGQTVGYRSHPQLTRFREQRASIAFLRAYLAIICEEAASRGYRFDKSKIRGPYTSRRIVETSGQLQHEWAHLKRKLRARAPSVYRAVSGISTPVAHPLFRIVPGPVQPWEKR